MTVLDFWKGLTRRGIPALAGFLGLSLRFDPRFISEFALTIFLSLVGPRF